jgi:long-chain acyl-CoA synthetase
LPKPGKKLIVILFTKEKGMNIANVLVQGAMCFPQKKALIYANRGYTYEELNAIIDRLTLFLRDLGVTREHRVSLYLPNIPEWLMFYYGIARVGATSVCIASAFKRQEVTRLINDSLSSVVVTCEELLSQLPNQKEIPHIKDIVVIERDQALRSVIEGKQQKAITPNRVECEGNDVATLLYTGGTTGVPKGAMITHKNLLYSAYTICYYERTVPEDVGLCFMPMTHVFGQCHIMNSIFYGCATLVLLKGFDMDGVLASVLENKITRFYAVPTIYIRFLNNPESKKYLKTLSYVFSAATSMPEEVVRQWHEEYRLPIHESYGMTESASITTFNHRYRHKVGSVGVPAGVSEIRLVDGQDKEVGPGETGEIVIRSPNIMKGYFNQPEETAHALRNGWFHSGDVGRFDEEGYLYIVDRIKDVIITGGENVFPREVEEVLYAHDAVNECAVVGWPHPEFGEAVTAFVTLKEAKIADEEEMIRFCKERLARYKVPKKIHFIKELPKSPQGKILRRELKKK